MEIVIRDAAFAQALALYPSPLQSTNGAFWQSLGFTSATDELILSVVEMRANDDIVTFVAPTVAGDYSARHVFVLRTRATKLPDNSLTGAESQFEPHCYVKLLSERSVHVTPFKADYSSTSVFLAPSGTNLTNLGVGLTPATLFALRNKKLMEFDGFHNLGNYSEVLKQPVIAGTALEFLIVVRDSYGNLMEGFEADDVMMFLASVRSAVTSPQRIMDQVSTGGLYHLNCSENPRWCPTATFFSCSWAGRTFSSRRIIRNSMSFRRRHTRHTAVWWWRTRVSLC